MRIRSVLTGALALVAALPLAVAAPVSAYERGPAREGIPTRVDIHSIGSGPLDYNDSFTIRGQVIYTDPEDGQQYGAEGTVTLERRFAGATDWVPLGSDDMSVYYPVFAFYSNAAQRNAEYRVDFLASDRYAASTGSLQVRVARTVTAGMSEPRENVFYLAGRVIPRYAGHPITLMRKKCSSCSWRAYATKPTTDSSHYRFRLPLPESGAHYFRTRVTGDLGFVTSYSSSYQLMRLF